MLEEENGAGEGEGEDQDEGVQIHTSKRESLPNSIAPFRIVPEILDNCNYFPWSFWLKSYLMLHDLWDIIDGTKEKPNENQPGYKLWRKKNTKALGAIYISCGPSILETQDLLKKDTAKDLWDELATRFWISPEEENEAGAGEIEEVKQDGAGEDSNDDDAYKLAEPLIEAEAVEIEEVKQDGAGEDSNDDGAYKRVEPLIENLERGNWENAKTFFKQHPDSLKGQIDGKGNTALMVLVTLKKERFVKELVEKMSPEELELQNVNADNVLHIAAEYDCAEMAKIFVTKNSKLKNAKLVCQKNINGEIPLLVAARLYKYSTLNYLYTVTPKKELSGKNGMAGATLLRIGMQMNLYDMILDLLAYQPLLGVTKDKYERTLMNELAICPYMTRSRNQSSCWQQLIGAQGKPFWHVYKLLSGTKNSQDSNLKHVQTHNILEICCEQISSMEVNQLIELQIPVLLHASICRGNLHFLKSIMNYSPHHFQNLWYGDYLLREAITRRNEKIFQFLIETELAKHWANQSSWGNSLLHNVAELSYVTKLQLQRVSGAALQMQRELQWFKEVEKNVLPFSKTIMNEEDLTVKEMFTENHKQLFEKGEKWMKETSQYCMVVATLISTVMFAAAFTIPGGNNDTGHPIFENSPSFLLFIISDALSLFSSISSVLMFLSILTARYAEEDFLLSLPRKLIIGLSTLFLSIALMMVTFAVTIVIVLQGKAPWIVVPVTLFAIAPVSLFAFLQFPLFAEMCTNTFGSVFDNEKSQKYVSLNLAEDIV